VIVAGIDPSSACTGVALVEDDKVLEVGCWEVMKTGSKGDKLVNYFSWLMAWLVAKDPDMVCVEDLHVTRNAKTAMVLARYQCVSVIVPKLRGLLVVETPVTTARLQALGRGDYSKAEAWKIIKDRFPEHDFGNQSDGPGGDKADAVVLALAAKTIAEGK